MTIHGLSKLTLLDFPEHIACTVFTGGCNFRCPYCHNAGLVLGTEDTPVTEEDEFFGFLDSRRHKLEGVCITGGEPTLNEGLDAFISRIRDMGFKVKLDSNGYRPEVLKDLFDKGLLDMIAMDIKNSPSKYARTVGLPEDRFDMGKIRESVSIIMNSGVPYEFRTTVIRELHEKQDFEEMGEWLKGADAYYIQNFKATDRMMCVLTGEGGTYSPCPETELTAFRNIMRRYIPNSHIRGND